MISTHHTDDAPAALGPYSQAVSSGPFVFTSGQVGLVPATGDMAEGFEAQTRQVLDNLEAVLRAANCQPSDVVKTTIYLTNLANFAKVNELYGRFMGDHRPARSTVEVSALPKGALVEIDMVAIRP